MSRGRRIALGILAALVALLAINAVIVGNETKPAEVTIDGGEILELPAGDVQVYEEGPTRSAQALGREALRDLDPKALPPELRRAAKRGNGGSVGLLPSVTPIVLLHCYSCSLHWFDRLAPILARDHRVIRIDLLGHGGSEKPSGGYGIEEQAATVAAALDRLEVQGAVVVGHSMGFSVATALAERASQLVDRVVNIGEGPDTEDCSLPFEAKLAYVPVLGEALWRLTPSFAVEDGYGSAFAPDYEISDGFPNPDQVLDDHEAMTYTAFEEAHEATDEFTAELSLADRVRPLAIPLLSIFGAEDRICDAEPAQAEYSSIPGARVTTLRGVGHSPNIEAPRETAGLIEEFAADAGDATIAPPPKDVGRDREPEGRRRDAGRRGRDRGRAGAKGTRPGNGGRGRARNDRR